MSDADVLAQALAESGVDPRFVPQLARYGALVLEANRAFNLTAARDPRAFASHILDALTLAGDIDGPLIDLGSGAGLPGIPLAIATGQRVVLVDSMKKKGAFLARALTELAIEGTAVTRRAESVGADPAFREQFRCATARAVSTAPTVAELTVPLLMVGGRALLQRGMLEERERQAVVDAAPMLGAEFTEERHLAGDRRILVLVKRDKTPQRFPRREGIPEKRPLCFT